MCLWLVALDPAVVLVTPRAGQLTLPSATNQNHPLSVPTKQNHSLIVPTNQNHSLIVPTNQNHLFIVPTSQNHSLIIPTDQSESSINCTDRSESSSHWKTTNTRPRSSLGETKRRSTQKSNCIQLFKSYDSNQTGPTVRTFFVSLLVSFLLYVI